MARSNGAHQYANRSLFGILPGQYYDAETGLAYNLARDYDAAIGVVRIGLILALTLV